MPEYFKIVKSKDPMIRHNYVGYVGKLVSVAHDRKGREWFILEIDWGVDTGIQSFLKEELEQVLMKEAEANFTRETPKCL